MIIDALVGKDGLVPETEKDKFRQEVKISLSQVDNTPVEPSEAKYESDEEKKAEVDPRQVTAFEPDYSMIDFNGAS